MNSVFGTQAGYLVCPYLNLKIFFTVQYYAYNPTNTLSKERGNSKKTTYFYAVATGISNGSSTEFPMKGRLRLRLSNTAVYWQIEGLEPWLRKRGGKLILNYVKKVKERNKLFMLNK